MVMITVLGYLGIYFLALCGARIAQLQGRWFFFGGFCLTAAGAVFEGCSLTPLWLTLTISIALAILICLLSGPLTRLYWIVAIPVRRHFAWLERRLYPTPPATMAVEDDACEDGDNEEGEDDEEGLNTFLP